MNIWLAYMDIEFIDMILFMVLFALIILGLYIMVKKDLFLGMGQIFLTLLTPYSILVLMNAHKEFWEIEQKRWVSMFLPYDYTSGDNTFISIMILALVPLFIITTVKCIKTISSKKES